MKFNGALLHIDDKRIFFDYSDDSKFIDAPQDFDFYFKRSLLVEDKVKNIYPLNFNVPLAHKSLLLLMNLNSDLLFYKFNRTEVIRALDRFSLFTNSSHEVLDIKNYNKKLVDYGGNIIFHTRLWNPNNSTDPAEKERRKNQNDFRINACSIIKKNFKNASVGLFADDFSKEIAPDLLLEPKHSNKKYYFDVLKKHNICIADDGLKDTPGWKIGEYALLGKAIITTPINISVDHFKNHVNYEKVTTRNSYLELPDRINYLLDGKKYLEMGKNNLEWGEEYLHPRNYIKRIISLISNIEEAI